MPEETVGELYAKITADIKEFESDIDTVYDRLDKLEEKDISVQAETKAVESTVSSLGTELRALGGTLATVFHYLHETSGGLQAMTNMASGLIGAGVDTFLIEVMIPLWDPLKTSIMGGGEETEKATNTLDHLAEVLTLTDEGVLILKDDTMASNEHIMTFLNAMNEGKVTVDDYGNAVFQVGEVLYYYDGATGAFVESTTNLNTEILGLNTNLGITTDLINDVSTEWNVMAKDVQLYAEGGKEALESLWAEDTSKFPGSGYISDVASAYEEVRIRLGTLLVEMGINPRTGGEITTGQKIEAQIRYGGAYGDAEELAQYLMSGGQ